MDSPRYLEFLSATAIDAALSHWCQGLSQFSLLVLLPEASADAIPELQAACRRAGVSLAGAVFPMLLQEHRTVQQGALLLPLEGAPAPMLVEGVSQAGAVERLAGRLSEFVEQELGNRETEATLFCIFDALVPNIATHLDAWYLALADRVHYAGVNAGSERFVSIPCLFDNER
ncbi:MAG TPA: histidine kinase, partial [Azospira sp.]|nr:histidine kinase [Azospira sp.]